MDHFQFQMAIGVRRNGFDLNVTCSVDTLSFIILLAMQWSFVSEDYVMGERCHRYYPKLDSKHPNKVLYYLEPLTPVFV